MDEPSHGTKELSITLFDRWGNLESEYCTHPCKKGTKAWGKKLNEGDIQLITHIFVEKDFRRKGYIRKMLENIWAKAQAISSTC